jgi:2-succinyl-5-enolpyruvyl-6-hydroxy-3-cyclohexene-1-carboxylate synthase
MYSNKENVNILTALLEVHGVKHAVVCPGSRNAPIVHNLNECPGIACYPVTDERSAGFYALGMVMQTGAPVAVCVTSGTALLNLAPAVAEAFYQHLPLVVISADRPACWVGQLDGQTLPQPDALGRFVKQAVSLPEPVDDEQRWYCNRLVNEALLALGSRGGGPVHINVPIAEPLFDFSVESLPCERAMTLLPAKADGGRVGPFCLEAFVAAERPMVVVGQMAEAEALGEALGVITRHAVVLHESLCAVPGICRFDEVLCRAGQDDGAYMPDFVLYVGGSIVSKRLKKFLRKAGDARMFFVAEDGAVCDTFMHLEGIIEGSPADVLQAVAAGLCAKPESASEAYRALWQQALVEAARLALDYEPRYSQMAAVKYFEEQLEDMDYQYHVHYANSTSVRLANIYADHYVYCNRGVNGIEGSLSAAAGFSVTAAGMVFCVVGDLSFFYDQNALWNRNLKGNLRIILLNNGGGGIFHQLKGLGQSAARDGLVAAAHHTEARGICIQNDVGYLAAKDMQEMRMGIVRLLTEEVNRPMLLEVFTDVQEDERAMKTYLEL